MNKKYFGIERRAVQNLPAQIVTFYETREEADKFREKLGENYKVVDVNKSGTRLEIYAAG